MFGSFDPRLCDAAACVEIEEQRIRTRIERDETRGHVGPAIERHRLHDHPELLPEAGPDELHADALRAHGVALAIGDHPKRPFQTYDATADWRYIRFHYGLRR